MAAAAYDVAALALKGGDADLNFPNFVASYPVPASSSAVDIRNAAAAAAASLRKSDHQRSASIEENARNNDHQSRLNDYVEFIDEEALLNMPNLLVNMAEGMMVSPPRMNSPSSDNSPVNSDGESLWSYY